MKKSRCILVFYLCVATTIVRGQPFKVTRYSAKYGLGTTAINHLVQDSIGFLWLATNEGLMRYDGKKFQLVKAGRFTFLALHHDRLFVGSDSLRSLSPNIKDAREMLLPINSGLLMNDDRMVFLPSGEIWWLDNDGIHARINSDVNRYPFPETAISGVDWILAGGANNALWLMTTNGTLFKWERSSKKFQSVVHSNSLGQVNQVMVYDQQTLIAGTTKGLFQIRLDEKQASWESLKGDQPFHHLLKDTRGDLWISSLTGQIFKGYRENKSFVFRKITDGSEPHRVADLPFKQVRKIFSDRNNNLWVAHDSGLSLLSETPFIISDPKLPNDVVRSMAFIGKDKIYLSCIGGFYEADILGHNSFDIKTVSLGANLFPNGIGGHGNRLWIGGSDDNLYTFENNKLSKPLNLRFRGSNIFYVFCDRDGNAWVSQAQRFNPIIGVLKVKPDLTVIEYNQKHGFASRMLVTRQASNGTIFCAGIGEATYLYRYDEDHDSFINMSLEMPFDYGENFEVHDLAIESDSVIWLASTAGLLKFSGKKIEKIPFPDLSSKEVVAVTIGKDSSVWASTEENGLVRIAKDGTYSVFNAEAGIPSNIMWYRSLYTDADGRIWAGTKEGMSLSRRPSPKPMETEPPVSLLVNVNGKPANSKTNYGFQSSLVFDFITLNYPTRSITYQYKTEGKDDEWRNLQTNASLKLDELENGQYEIQVRAKQVGGYRWSEPMVYRFSISKPWYRNNYAVVVYSCMFIALIISSVRIYNRNLIYEKKKLEIMVSARTKQLTEKQDEIIAQNQELQQLSDELAAHNENILEQKNVIENQNILLSQSKAELEQKVEDRTIELKLSNEELVQQNVQLEQFAFMTAHNLRAPVARLLGLSSLFELTKVHDHESLELVKRIQLSAKDLDETIGEIARILNIQRGMHGTFVGVSLKNAFDQVVPMFSEELKQHKALIRNELQSFHVVTGIESYMHSIFYNIISNSVKYLDEHRPLVINVSAEDANDQWHVMITDNGIGFDSDHYHAKLCKPFTRFNTKKEGRGLGLYLMKIQMEMMRGKIFITSKINEGTKVTLHFPKFS